MTKGFVKKALSVACAASILLATFSMAGCEELKDQEITDSNANYTVVIKETENVYIMHKAASDLDDISSFKYYQGFKTACGYYTQTSGGQYSHGPYIIHDEKGIVLSGVEYRLYNDQNDISEPIKDNIVECEECYGK